MHSFGENTNYLTRVPRENLNLKSNQERSMKSFIEFELEFGIWNLEFE